MSNVTQISSWPARYDEPDFRLILQSAKDISRLVIFHSDQNSNVMEKAQRISTYCLELDRLVAERLSGIATKAAELDCRELFQFLSEIDHELSGGKLSSDERLSANSARKELLSQLEMQLMDLYASLDEARSDIQKKSGEIQSVILAERIQSSREHHEAIILRGNREISEKRDEQKSLAENRDKLIAAQDVIRARNIADMYKDFIPDNLDKIDLKNPEVEAIRQAVVVLKKILGEVSEGFRYIDLADQRQALDKKIGHISEEIQAIQKELDGSDRVLRDLKSIAEIDDRRRALLAEVGKLIGTLSGLGKELEAVGDSVITESGVGRIAKKVGDYAGRCLNARSGVILI
ncbi:alpha-xenorhabdolysin family binary toxin subunit B [Chitinibacteraceae bacterium HSL-7]